MATTYLKSSPYYKTSTHGNFLDVWEQRTFPKLPDDVVFTINQTYQNRPDLLANDLYGDSGLWWVFAVRNPDIIKDPIYDFAAGVRIRIPKKTTLQSALG
jgi:hypothetical protein